MVFVSKDYCKRVGFGFWIVWVLRILYSNPKNQIIFLIVFWWLIGIGSGTVVVLSEIGSEIVEQFSSHHQFRSYLSRQHTTPLRRVNAIVEKKVKNPTVLAQMTSDQYKDKQREYVYSLLNNMSEKTTIDKDVIDRVKVLYHLYRNCMSRIHQLHIVLAGMFFIVLNNH